MPFSVVFHIKVYVESRKCGLYETRMNSRPDGRRRAGGRPARTQFSAHWAEAVLLLRSHPRMSSRKRKGDLPENATSNVGLKASRMADDDDDDVDESDVRRQLAAMQAQRDEAQAQLTASHAALAAAALEIERMRAAALVPCPRCNFHADWTVRVRTMAGHVHTVACPDGPASLIVHVKQGLAEFDPKFHIQEQLTLVLPCEASSSSSSDGAAPIDTALADDRTLSSCGISKGGLLDLLLVDMVWDDASQSIIDRIQHGSDKIEFSEDMPIRDTELALSWALVNAVLSVLSVCRCIHSYSRWTSPLVNIFTPFVSLLDTFVM